MNNGMPAQNSTFPFGLLRPTMATQPCRLSLLLTGWLLLLLLEALLYAGFLKLLASHSVSSCT